MRIEQIDKDVLQITLTQKEVQNLKMLASLNNEFITDCLKRLLNPIAKTRTNRKEKIPR